MKVEGGPGERSASGFDAVFLAALLGVAGYLVVSGVDRSLWHDEALSAFVARRDLAGLLRASRADSNPPLYFLLLGAWTRIFGAGETALRLYSGLCHLATIPAMHALGLAVAGERRTARLAAFLWAFSPFALMQSQNVRMYAELALFGALALVGFFRLLERRSRSRGAALLYVLANAGGSFTHYWWIFFAGAQLLAWLVVYRGESSRRFLALFALGLLPFLVLGLPVLFFQTRNVGTTWVGQAGLSSWLPRLGSTFLLYFGGEWGRGWFGALVYAGILALVAAGLRRSTAHDAAARPSFSLWAFVGRGARLALIVLVFGTLVVPLVVSRIKPLYKPRFTILALVPFVVLLACLLARYAPRRALAVAAAVLGVAVSLQFLAGRRGPDIGTDRASMARVVAEARAGDILVFTSLSRLTSEYYLERFGAGDRFARFSFPAEIEEHPGWRDVHRLVARRDELEAEAARLLATLRGLVAERPRRIWLFFGSDVEVTEPLRRDLDRTFEAPLSHDLRGSFYDRVLVYGGGTEPRPGGGGTPPRL